MKLRDRTPTVARGEPVAPEPVLDAFMEHVAERGLTPYPAQEEAFLEIASGRHVVLGTPTGSGKSLVALFLHMKALSEGRRSFYTAPVKALVSEKFFALCDEFGAENVGMLTGDASINWAAPLVCCTAEVLSNMALRQGESLDAAYVVMDEFHYYSDRERGVAWQVPLLALPHTTFLLMSATLGDTRSIEEHLHRRSGREVARVTSEERPVPLDFEYRETPIHETLEDLLESGRAPVYVVNFTQRECAELAQGLTSDRLCTREQRDRIGEALGDFHFDSPYGKSVRRFLLAGIGIHHAGLLPKYRLLVEQLAQQGLLRVICGTDTLGVGVNIPIRSVLFTKLSKFDGEKVGLLSVRDFRQIAGRAGRKGFDVRGSVVCQAPEHVIEKRRARDAGKKPPPRRPPPRNFVPWSRDTFERLIRRPPEPLISRFRVNHGMLVAVLQRDAGREDTAFGYRTLLGLVELCHESPATKRRLRRACAVLFRALRRAGIIQLVYRIGRGPEVRIDETLQRDFSLHQTLSLYLVDAASVLDPEHPSYAEDVLSLVEAILENPEIVLRKQVRRARDEALARMKAEGVPFEERIRRLDDVTHPKPSAGFIYSTFNLFAESHPWVGAENIRPKSIAREMYETYASFDVYVRLYDLAPSEGVLLRYLAQVYNTLGHSVPETEKTAEVHEIVAFFRTLLERVDSSLVEEWESLLRPEPGVAAAPTAPPPRAAAVLGPRAFAARVRAEMLNLVRALSDGDYEEAARFVRQDPDDVWDADRLRTSLAPFLSEYGRIVFDPSARKAHHTVVKKTAPERFDVMQVLVDPKGENLWYLAGEVDLRDGVPEGPLVRLTRIGT